MTTLRFKMVEEAISRKAVDVKIPVERLADYLGKYVFDRAKMRKYLPKDCYVTLLDTTKIAILIAPIPELSRNLWIIFLMLWLPSI